MTPKEWVCTVCGVSCQSCDTGCLEMGKHKGLVFLWSEKLPPYLIKELACFLFPVLQLGVRWGVGLGKALQLATGTFSNLWLAHPINCSHHCLAVLSKCLLLHLPACAPVCFNSADLWYHASSLTASRLILSSLASGKICVFDSIPYCVEMYIIGPRHTRTSCMLWLEKYWSKLVKTQLQGELIVVSKQQSPQLVSMDTQTRPIAGMV